MNKRILMFRLNHKVPDEYRVYELRYRIPIRWIHSFSSSLGVPRFGLICFEQAAIHFACKGARAGKISEPILNSCIYNEVEYLCMWMTWNI